MENKPLCSVPGCGKPHSAKALCVNHYYRLRRRGSVLTRKERGLLSSQQKCVVPECERLRLAGEYCQRHYSKLRSSGTLDRLVFGPEWRAKQAKPRTGSLGHIDPTRDTRPWHAGYYAVNLVNDVKQKAIKRGKQWALTAEQAYRLIVAECFYCGIKPNWPQERNGIDRKECSVGYTPENCVSACWQCNAAKNSHSIEAFRSWVERLYQHFVVKGKE